MPSVQANQRRSAHDRRVAGAASLKNNYKDQIMEEYKIFLLKRLTLLAYYINQRMGSLLFILPIFLGVIWILHPNSTRAEPIIFTATSIFSFIYYKINKYFTASLLEHTSLSLPIATALNKFPYLTIIAANGIKGTGKSTLLFHLIKKSEIPEPTRYHHAYITNFSNTKIRFAVILDGAGQIPAQQNKIMELSEILIVVLDHNPSDTINEISTERLDENKNFITDLSERISINKSNKIKEIIILVNKSDLYEKIHHSFEKIIVPHLQPAIDHLMSQNRHIAVRIQAHSNHKSVDINNLTSLLFSLI